MLGIAVASEGARRYGRASESDPWCPPMFQTFDETSDPSLGAGRVALLRAWLANKSLDGFVVPRAD